MKSIVMAQEVMAQLMGDRKPLSSYDLTVVAPGGLPNVGAQRHQFKLGTTDCEIGGCDTTCIYATCVGTGDESLQRFLPTGKHDRAEDVREERAAQQRKSAVRIRRWADDRLHQLRARL
jgi:hypothetical protein